MDSLDTWIQILGLAILVAGSSATASFAVVKWMFSSMGKSNDVRFGNMGAFVEAVQQTSKENHAECVAATRLYMPRLECSSKRETDSLRHSQFDTTIVELKKTMEVMTTSLSTIERAIVAMNTREAAEAKGRK